MFICCRNISDEWEYYVNMIHEVDKFVYNLTSALEERDEDSIVVFFGDHLPSLGLEDSDMASGDTFKTKYATWNNFGLAKEDADLAAYELLASTTDALGIHEGTIFTYEQNALNSNLQGSEEYLSGLNQLQYDLLYGERYAYNGTNPYPATELVMGVEETSISNVRPSSFAGYVTVSGENFTRWSRIYVNGEKVPSYYVNSTSLRLSAEDISDGDTVTVCQVGSSNTIFRSTNDYIYDDPNADSTEVPLME